MDYSQVIGWKDTSEEIARKMVCSLARLVKEIYVDDIHFNVIALFICCNLIFTV